MMFSFQDFATLSAARHFNLALLQATSMPTITIHGTDVDVIGSCGDDVALAHFSYDEVAECDIVEFGGMLSDLETWLDNCDEPTISKEVISRGLKTIYQNLHYTGEDVG